MKDTPKVVSILAVIIVVIVGGVYFRIRGSSPQDVALLERLAALENKNQALQNKLQSLERKQAVSEASLKEIENRKVVKEKSQDELLTAAVARVAPVVVSIVVSKDVPKLEVTYQNPFGDDPFFKDFDIRIPVYQQKGTERQNVGAGTGFLIRSDGYIVTNRHVVADDQAGYTVLLADGKQKPAQVVYRDSQNDVALIKIDGSGYGTATFGNSGALQLGQTVVAIGNALGEYNNSASVGIISGLNRTIEAGGSGGTETLTGVIQTDAAINPGNSGGPLVDLNGQVVGINVATIVESSNISFSIPANIVKSIIKTELGK